MFWLPYEDIEIFGNTRLFCASNYVGKAKEGFAGCETSGTILKKKIVFDG